MRRECRRRWSKSEETQESHQSWGSQFYSVEASVGILFKRQSQRLWLAVWVSSCFCVLTWISTQIWWRWPVGFISQSAGRIRLWLGLSTGQEGDRRASVITPSPREVLLMLTSLILQKHLLEYSYLCFPQKNASSLSILFPSLTYYLT